MTQLLFYSSLAIVAYTYIGYPIVLLLLVHIKRLTNNKNLPLYDFDEMPQLSLIVPCYNEEDIIEDKIKNSLELKYPKGKLELVFITDGSTDATNSIIKNYPEIQLHFEPARKGKNAAINRLIPQINTPVIVFCDANTMLNQEALIKIARHYKDPNTGSVAGEKRVKSSTEDAAGSGEGAYWKYESKLKQWDSELNSIVGAAGELFSIRTELYEEVPEHVLIEDFRLSVNIAKKGYRVIYEPEAFATEQASASIEEESKRKVRISAGGLIEVAHFIGLLNFFKYGWLSFQYFSHRMLRWTLAPLSLIIILVANIILAIEQPFGFFGLILVLQLGFYILGVLGHLLRQKDIKIKGFFIPYYFLFMNFSVFQGFIRLLKGKQSAIWDKAKRAPAS